MPFYYQFLDLPDPPEELIQSVDLSRRPTVMEIGIHNKRSLKNWYGRDYKAAVNVRTRHAEFDQWVRENIVSDFVDAGVNYVTMSDDAERPLSTGAHVDVIRKYTLLYNIRTGGPDATTIWWQEKGYPEVRDPGTQVEDMELINEVQRVIFPERRWCLLGTQVLHSVENLIEPRISFQISLNDISWVPGHKQMETA